MLRQLISRALAHRYPVLLLLVAAGVSAFRALPIDAFPDVAGTQVKIVMKAPGMTPEKVEMRIVQPLAQLEQARQQELRAHAKVEREARQLVSQAEAARQNAATQARIRQQTQSNAALVAKAYALGESAFADTLLANRQALEAAQAAETAQLDALELRARLLLDAHLIWVLEHE